MAKNDRRVRYTKQVIKSSLLELLQTKPFEQITVKELCQKADINRATFYSHYDTLISLIEEIEYEECKELFDMLDDILVDENHLVHSTTILLQFLKEHSTLRDIFLRRIVIGTGLTKLTQDHMSKTLDRIITKGKLNRTQAYWLLSFIVHGMRESLHQWFEAGMQDEDTFIQTLCLFIRNGLSAFA